MKQLLNKTKGDQIIWAVVLVLSFVSMLAVYSSASFLAYRTHKSASFFLIKQIMVLGLGFLIIYLVHNINYAKFAKVAVFAYILSIPLLLWTLFFGTSYNDGARWIRVPGLNLTFQTSDLAKLALFMFLARVMSIKQPVIKDFKKGFIPVLLPMLVTCALIAPANLSTAMMLGATCSIVFFIGRVQVKHLLFLAGMGLVGLVMLYFVSKVTHFGRATTWMHRIESFAGAKGKDDIQKDGYQVLQAKIAIANGGFTGRGPGNSLQRNFLPHADSDFIYAIIIEEYGLIGGGLIIVFYLLFLWRSILIFRRCPYAFGAFLAVALSVALVFQAMLNMAVNVHLMPVTGITLPMVSMGGSSIWFTSVAIGIVLSVSKYVDEMEGGKNGGPKKATVRREVATEEDETPVVETAGESKIFIKTNKKGNAGNAVVPAI